MRLDEMNWMDVESYLEKEDRLILVVGACEQHGYLSLLTDVKIPLALADAASHQSGVLVAPPINYGVSPYFVTYPGTLSLRVSTLLDVVEDIIRTAYWQGFRKILVMNGHGGNDALRGRLGELMNQMPGLRFAWYAWWQSNSTEAVAVKYELERAHANWMEAFPFCRVADLPQGEKTPPSYRGMPNAEQTRALYGDGVFGGAYQVDDAVLQEVFDACLQDVMHLLQFE